MKKYLDIKTIEVSDLVAEYMVKYFFHNSFSKESYKKSFVRIVEIDKLINEYLKNISKEEVHTYTDEVRKQDYKSRPCFAFTSTKLTSNPLRLYLNSYTKDEPICIVDFSLASDYYIECLETGEIKID